jgi:NADH-quinone oxidoreductase subunit M
MIDLLATIIFLPAIGGLIILLIPSRFEKVYKIAGIAVSTVVFLLSIPIFLQFSPHAGIQFERNIPWVPELGITFHIGIDGISLLLVLLTTFLTPLVVIGGINSVKKNLREYIALFLFMETFLIGTFSSLNLFLFYIFWEGSLIPMYLIIGIWGGERRIYATIKFFLYTFFGSVLMLAGIIFLYIKHGQQFGFYSFELYSFHQLALTPKEEMLTFLAFFIAFAIKVPIFPFHTWLPDAHTEAPTGGSVVLAALLLKMGTYGIMRFAVPLFPNAFLSLVDLIAVLSLIGIIYGALVAMVQPDFKRLIAFSSVSHMGFVVLGICSMNIQSLTGATLQMINHGLSTGALFFLVGMIYDRRHTRMFSDFGGLGKVMPVYGGLFLTIALSSIGLPGTNGFIGEFLIITGSIKFNKVYGILCASGVIFAAAYMLWAYKKVFHGEIKIEENKNLKDLNPVEIFIISCILIFVLWIGIYPSTFLDKIQPSILNFIDVFKGLKPYGGF